jgi:hypothetical protein
MAFGSAVGVPSLFPCLLVVWLLGFLLAGLLFFLPACLLLMWPASWFALLATGCWLLVMAGYQLLFWPAGFLWCGGACVLSCWLLRLCEVGWHFDWEAL